MPSNEDKKIKQCEKMKPTNKQGKKIIPRTQLILYLKDCVIL